MRSGRCRTPPALPLLRRVFRRRIGRQFDPGVARFFPHRDGRRRKRRIGEGADGHGDMIGKALAGPIERRAADRTEVEGHRAAALGLALPLRRLACNGNLLMAEARLIADHRAGAALALQAMTHRHPRRLAFDGEVKLAAATGGVAGGHGRALLNSETMISQAQAKTQGTP